MTTEIMPICQSSLAKAKRIIRGGGLVAFPTETVYGLGANAFDDSAVAGIFKAKGRPQDNPLIVHIPDFSAAGSVSDGVTDTAKKLAAAFMPGPVTVVVCKGKTVSPVATCGLDTVGIRVPSHAGARSFLRACGVPVAAPSANTSKRPSPTEARFVADDMNGKIPLILDGGPCEVGIESTVIDARGDVPVVLRPGAVTGEMIERVCGRVAFAGGDSSVPMSPGTKYVHYAPSCEMALVSGDFASRIKELYFDGCTVIGYDGDIERAVAEGMRGLSLGADNVSAMNRFYRLLREAERDSRMILCRYPTEDEVGKSLLNRMIKACGGKVL